MQGIVALRLPDGPCQNQLGIRSPCKSSVWPKSAESESPGVGPGHWCSNTHHPGDSDAGSRLRTPGVDSFFPSILTTSWRLEDVYFHPHFIAGDSEAGDLK